MQSGVGLHRTTFSPVSTQSRESQFSTVRLHGESEQPGIICTGICTGICTVQSSVLALHTSLCTAAASRSCYQGWSALRWCASRVHVCVRRRSPVALSACQTSLQHRRHCRCYRVHSSSPRAASYGSSVPCDAAALPSAAPVPLTHNACRRPCCKSTSGSRLVTALPG